jgi:PIN domain nuclease of toxin-antitoxin system
VKYLIDTHIAVWIVTGSPKLPRIVRSKLAGNHAFVSAASIWEVAIKSALRRGHFDDMRVTGAQALSDFVAAGFEMVEVSPEDAAAIDGLPLIHGDPFDRLLVAQAARRSMTFLTHEKLLADYGQHVMLV